MVSFTDALADFVRTGTVDVREAFRKAPDRDRLLESLKRNGIDTQRRRTTRVTGRVKSQQASSGHQVSTQ